MSFSVSIVCHVCRVYQHALMIGGSHQYWGYGIDDIDGDKAMRDFIVTHIDCTFDDPARVLELIMSDPYTDSDHLPGYTDLETEPGSA